MPGAALLVSLLALRAASPDVSVPRRHVEALAGETFAGRATGTEGADRAAAYLARELSRLGATPLGDEGSFLARFEVVTAVRSGPDTGLVLHGEGARAVEGLHDVLPVPFSAHGRASGDPVFAGYGIAAPELGYDDWAGIDARGAVAVVLRGEPQRHDPRSIWNGLARTRYADLRSKVRAAEEHGAAAVLVVSPEVDDGEDRFLPLGPPLLAPPAAIPVLQVKRHVAREILAGADLDLDLVQEAIDGDLCPRSRRLPGSPVSVTVDLERESALASNVLGAFGPATAEAVVVGAHYDHLGLVNGRLHPGADDNASGVAAVLAMAGRLDPAKLRRRVIVAFFAGEELGLAGSGQYVDHPPHPLQATRAMVNLDMVGHLDTGGLLVGGVGTSPSFRRLLDTAWRGLPMRVRFAQDGHGPSDHASFYGRDRPVLFLFTGLHEHYHGASDRPRTLDFVGLGTVTTALTRLVEALASEDAPLAFRVPVAAIDDAPVMGAMGLGGGTYVGLDAEIVFKRVRVRRVVPGSMAAAWGLRDGDVVRQAGARSVGDVLDVVRFLASDTPGVLVVERQGRRLRLPRPSP